MDVQEMFLIGVVGAFSLFAVTLFITAWVVNSKR